MLYINNNFQINHCNFIHLINLISRCLLIDRLFCLIVKSNKLMVLLLKISSIRIRRMITDVAPYKLIDIGANLTNPCLNDRNLCDVVDRAKAAGVCKIIVTGTSIETAKEAMRLSRLYPNYLFFTAGIHPHDAKYFNDESIAELEKLALEPECVAIGECGLDFNRNFSPQENQLTAFEAQVQLACKLKKTIFIHERDAHSALVEILKKYSLLIPYAVVHCFTGTAEQAKTYLDMGLYIGLTGSLWKDKLEFGVQYALRQGEKVAKGSERESFTSCTPVSTPL
ncbi:3'-5' ssDNA/RNA exonuclease TatD [Trichinella spiralis]|uniref:Deoxyribonuclease TATDN1 n=1 Tax=Trichinella spiralis TaxID=6334 RepID=A0ABR3KY82_TRISP